MLHLLPNVLSLRTNAMLHQGILKNMALLEVLMIPHIVTREILIQICHLGAGFRRYAKILLYLFVESLTLE